MINIVLSGAILALGAVSAGAAPVGSREWAEKLGAAAAAAGFAAPAASPQVPVPGKAVQAAPAQDWGAVPEAFAEARKYRFDIFGGDERRYEEVRRQSPHFNRYQTMEFSPEGRVRVIMTDMPSVGKYEIRLEEVVVRIKSPEFGPRGLEMTFVLSPDRKKLIDSGGKVWALY